MTIRTANRIAIALMLCIASCGGAGAESADSQAGDCYGAHEVFFGKEDKGCCAGLQQVHDIVPSETYDQDDYPDGCGPGNGPDDWLICLPCGDGECGENEQFCNCPEDCEAPPDDPGF